MKFLKAQTTNIRGIQHGKGFYFDADEGVRMESTNSLNLKTHTRKPIKSLA